MENRTEITLADQYAAALDWWRDAGVEHDFHDEPQSWLEEPSDSRPVQTVQSGQTFTAPEPIAPAITAQHLPDTLEAFRAWWIDPDCPIPSSSAGRIAPRGKAGAAMMIITPMPEAVDSDRLLSAAHGRLIGNILRALTLDPEEAYIASAIPAHMPLPDWNALRTEGLGEAIKRHIALAKPERLVLFGSNLPALLGHDPSSPPEGLSEIEGIPSITTFAPQRLLDHPRQRARLWQRLLQWNALQ